MIALKLNTHIWMSRVNRKIDSYLKHKNIRLLELEWNNYELLENDRNHFTIKGFHKFSESLSDKINNIVPSDSSLLILADSTIDYWNYDLENNKTNYADNYIKDLINSPVDIDSVCGSGFCAMKSKKQDFISRLKSNYNKYDFILFIGGWNDKKYSNKKLRDSIKEIDSLKYKKLNFGHSLL
jgi:hypothetical protein